jgi:ribonuclease HII
LGPLVVAGVFAGPEATHRFSRLAVRDSKALGSSAEARRVRKHLCEEISGCADHVCVKIVSPAEVDLSAARGDLNGLERRCACDILDSGPEVDEAIGDGRALFSPLRERYPFLRAQDRADGSCLVVGAASIIAKHHRDEAFRAIAESYEEEFGPIAGQGYANRATEVFLRAYHQSYGELPAETRLTWRWRVIQELAGAQQSLF